jgi:carboxyl-terminal processing protease
MRIQIKTVYIPIFIFSLLAVGVFLGQFLNFPMDLPVTAENRSRIKLNKLLDFINKDYVDNVNTDSIVNETVDNILEKLDPHSVYIPAAEQTLESQNMRGDFVGIGVNFYTINDTIAIVKTIENGPAAKAGLLPGDRILYANNIKLFGNKKPSDSLFSHLKGEENSEVNLTIFRKNSNKILKYKILRKTIPIKSVDVALLLKPKMGYIKINRFAETTYDEFKTNLTQLQKAGIQELVIDLRDNSGGYLEIAEKIADEFLSNGQLIVFTKNKKGKINKKFASSKGSFEKGKLIVLINEYSASASEILAGAIQDNDRGTIVGRRSFGKGLVQREMDFDDGSAVRLTIARYYTPTGRSIQTLQYG